MNRHYRRALVSVLSGVLLAMPIAPLAQAAGGPCDPPAFCPMDVRPFDGPNGPTGGQSNPQPVPVNPTPTKPQPASAQPVNAQPVNAQPVNAQPVNAQPASQASQTTASSSAWPSISVSPSSAAPGDPIVVTGTAYSPQGRTDNVFVNVKDPNGVNVDVRHKEITCHETDDVVLIFYQMFGLGCSADGGGPIIHTDNNGSFRAIVNVPADIKPGSGQVCAWSSNGQACAPFTIAAASPKPAPAPAPQPAPTPTDDSSATAAIQQSIQSFNDTFTQAIANQDASMMTDAVVGDISQSVVQNTQGNLDAGMVGVELQSVDWGKINVSGTTASAADNENWSVTFADGTTGTQSISVTYSLVLDNGTWMIKSMATK